MLTFVLSVSWVMFTVVAGGYYPAQGHHPYDEGYAPGYHNYEPKDYHFQYAVSDPHTGDHKSQWEIRENGVVRGMYSLLEADGTTRVVEYIADDHGFRATVKKIGTPIVPYHEGIASVPLPEAFSNSYHGAYSGEQENYENIGHAVPTELHRPDGGEHENYGNAVHSISAEQNQQSHPYSEEEENYGSVLHAIPAEFHNQNSAYNGEHKNYESNFHSIPANLNEHNHDTNVEIHGFTGNAEDDSAYTNYENEDKDGAFHQSSGHGHYPNNNHEAQSVIVRVPYPIPHQYQQPYAYIVPSYYGY